MSKPSRIIAAEIRQKGPMTFARFMELALYCPVCGYYGREVETVGRGGDFQTSVSVGPLFGELLARQFAAWMDDPDRGDAATVHWVEAGAHDGRLAADILGWMRECRRPQFERLEYHILEPSPVRTARQQQTLAGFLPQARWSSSWEDLRQATGGVRGVVFSNELLDAQPVHRLAWDRNRGHWMEWRVTLDGDRFSWCRHDGVAQPLRDALDADVPPDLREVLPDGYIMELSPAAEGWWQAAARSLNRGRVLTFDYGFEDDTALLPERAGGTLRSYRGHRLVADVLLRPGEQDITAHVHFGRIRRVGEAAGLKTEFLGEQGRFLSRCSAAMLESDRTGFDWDASRVRQFKTLIHPDHFGRSFRALLQSRF